MSAEERKCVCGKPLSLHRDSRETKLPPGAVLSHPGTPATPDPGDASEVEPLADVFRYVPLGRSRLEIARAVLASDWLAAREAAARAEERERIAQAARCGGCKGQGSHRRHCPRHPKYHPWIPLADRAESIGDSIGEPGLANRAWALAGAIRDEMPSHPYRPARIARGDS